MGFSIGNMLGFWALLGIPAVLLIHFLQRRSRVVVISTLFLLDQMRRESVSGNRIERLRSSIPLWLQLLMVLLITWLLVEPRWTKEEAVQRVAVVVDSSASMSVFKQTARERLDDALSEFESLVSTTEFVLLETHDGRSLFTGTQLSQLLEAIDAWEPFLGSHDPAPSLRLARSTVGAGGLIIFVTDQRPEQTPPFAARLLAVGNPEENCGFAGFSVEDKDGGGFTWKALVRNFGTQTQTRSWWIEAGEQRTKPTEISLEPGKIVPLQGGFPKGVDQCALVMESDRFARDDRLPMVRPKPKALSVWVPAAPGDPALTRFYGQVFSSFENVVTTATRGNADLEVATYDPLSPTLPERPACVFTADPRQSGNFLNGRISAIGQPLMNGLNWQGLLCRDSLRIPPRENDDVLLWQGDRPLIFLRRVGEIRQLCFNFDLRKSNARRLPAFVVLLHRFLGDLRESKIAPESRNFETGQNIALAHHRQPDAPPLERAIAATATEAKSVQLFDLGRASLLRAPLNPGYFEVTQGSTSLLRGAAHFADTRESDFNQASSHNDLAGAHAAIIERHSREDDHWRLWVLAALAVLLSSWHFVRKPVRENSAG
jgi:hypothetical protein